MSGKYYTKIYFPDQTIEKFFRNKFSVLNTVNNWPIHKGGPNTALCLRVACERGEGCSGCFKEPGLPGHVVGPAEDRDSLTLAHGSVPALAMENMCVLLN